MGTFGTDVKSGLDIKLVKCCPRVPPQAIHCLMRYHLTNNINWFGAYVILHGSQTFSLKCRLDLLQRIFFTYY